MSIRANNAKLVKWFTAGPQFLKKQCGLWFGEVSLLFEYFEPFGSFFLMLIAIPFYRGNEVRGSVFHFLGF